MVTEGQSARLEIRPLVPVLSQTKGNYPRSAITNVLHGTEPFSRDHQLCSYSRTSQHFMEPEGSLPCSQEPYSKPDESWVHTTPAYRSKIHFTLSLHFLNVHVSSTITQAVSRWIPTAEAKVRARVRSYGICGGQSGTGTGFLRVLRFPNANHSTDCSILIISHPGLVQ
jgi:hypothetical protein